MDHQFKVCVLDVSKGQYSKYKSLNQERFIDGKCTSLRRWKHLQVLKCILSGSRIQASTRGPSNRREGSLDTELDFLGYPEWSFGMPGKHFPMLGWLFGALGMAASNTKISL